MPRRGDARLALHETIRLADLANIAVLSSYHHQRTFWASRGVSPQVFVAHRRVESTKAIAPARMRADCVRLSARASKIIGRLQSKGSKLGGYA